MMFSLSFFSIQEFMKFTAQIVVERTQPGMRATVKEQGKIKTFICTTSNNLNIFGMELVTFELLLYNTIDVSTPQIVFFMINSLLINLMLVITHQGITKMKRY